MLNKKILLSVLMIGTIAVMAGAGTWAAFSDTESSTGNTFTAGTLDLALGTPSTTGVNIASEKVYPGASGSQSWSINNAGNINGKLKLAFAVATPTEGTPSTVDPGVSNLNSAVKVKVLVGGSEVYNGDLAGLATATIAYTPVNAGASSVVSIQWNIPTETDNGIQGDSTSFDVTFTLDQA